MNLPFVIDASAEDIVMETRVPQALVSQPTAASPATPLRSSMAPASSRRPYNTNWPSEFFQSLDWDSPDIPEGLRKAIKKRNKLYSPTDLSEYVQHLVRRIVRFEQNPPKERCHEVAKLICDKYPETFEDRDEDGEKRGDGYTGLGNKIRNRVMHVNRGSTDNRLRSPKVSKRLSEDSGTSQTPKKLADSFGCVRYLPEMPDGETEDSQEEVRLELVKVFSEEGSSPRSTSLVDDLMDRSYYLQRQDLTSRMSVLVVK
jgi:hypothetical protein